MRKAWMGVALAAILLMAAAQGAPAQTGTVMGSQIAPANGSLFGGWAARRGTNTYAQERAWFEGASGVNRKFDAYRWWMTVDDVVNGPFLRELLGTRVPVIGLTTDLRTGADAGQKARWGAIARGDYDAELRTLAQGLGAYGDKMIVVIHHEPEDDVDYDGESRYGTPAEYRAMFQRVAGIFGQYAANVEVGWVLMAWTWRDTNGNPDGPYQPADYYPGDQYVDWIGADGYNWYATDDPTTQAYEGRPWQWCYEIYDAFYAWGKARGKPLMFAEFGTNDDSAAPARSSDWLNGCRNYVKYRPEIKLTSYYHSYNWILDDNGGAAMTAFRSWGADPHFNVRPK